MKIHFEKPRSIPVADWLYPDRGMIKWQGFILSDHNEVMDFERAVRAAAVEEPPVDPEAWNRLLWRSLQTGCKLHLRVEAEDGIVERIGSVRGIHPMDFVLALDDMQWLIDYSVVKTIQEISYNE